ncbi:hypothetical protein SAMN05444156_1827 [Verrucomicrobium sp. GAS474]|uniref:hypothetical protein n=1 Tax=Verrucomicrobium sp. GAS474 TaxID=1882831 RepID=UPI00087CBD49|nr:hypothetical protein [Verrucomicrobium sp. GAS474]SDU07760.1 hypothetical protein SAMN05444156_1827 [Verrucomicrobium sp. GAS474]
MASADPTLFHRLSEEIRSVCRVVAEEGKESIFTLRKGGDRAIGEWLMSVRQAKEPIRSFQPPKRSKRLEDFAATLRGDLTRVHVMRVKGGRGTMQDAVVRSTLR